MIYVKAIEFEFPVEKDSIMAKYNIRFWFEHGGICVWGKNTAAKDKFGYAIKNECLPISKELINELNELEKRYAHCLNWDSPSDPPPWSEDEKESFRADARKAYFRLKDELGNDYDVVDAIDSCIYE